MHTTERRMLRRAKTLETRVARAVAVVAIGFFCAVLAPSAVAGPRCAVPAYDPAPEEVREAMRLVGLSDDAAMPIAKAIEQSCLSGTELALYDHLVRVILLGDRWRDVGGLTRLIHEMKHYADDLAGKPEDECGASRVAAAWADAHEFFNEARRERRYGAAFCAAETTVAAAAPSGEDAPVESESRFLQMASVLFLPPGD